MGIVDLGVLTWLCLEQSHEDVSRHEMLFLEVPFGQEILTICCVGASNFSYASIVSTPLLQSGIFGCKVFKKGPANRIPEASQTVTKKHNRIC